MEADAETPDADAPMGEATTEVTARMRRWALRSAADYLGRHTSSVENLRRLMLRRAARRHPEIGKPGAAALAAHAVAFCREHALVDDIAYAEAKVRGGIRKGHSRRRIALALGAKGVGRDAADEALEGADDRAAAAALARRRRIGPWRRQALDAEARRREAGIFGRNGFGGDTAAAVMAMTVEEAEEALAAAERAV